MWFPPPATLAGRAPALLRQCQRLPPLSSRIAPSLARARTFRSHPSSFALSSGARSFSIAARRPAAAAATPNPPAANVHEAPNPKAYLESGFVKPHDLVDVKKVIVIGSGGLSIGQAGEFDYSG